MDVKDIEKIAKRKRLKENVENLREEISREAAKIIKVKVSQDTAYWDLKEKLEQAENNHERLQQNMVEVQMQYETISGQYQEELRHRPEALNKLSSTRKICDVLEDYSERLKETLSRCKADLVALYDAYQKSAYVVKDARCKLEQKEKINEQLVENMREKEKLTNEHQSEMLKYFTASKQQADSELADLRAKMSSTQMQREELLTSVMNLNVEVEKHKHESMMKEQMLASLRDEMRVKTEEYHQHVYEARNTIAKQESELKKASEAYESLKQALCYQEQFTRNVCDEKSALQEQFAAMEEEHGKLAAAMAALQIDMKVMSADKASVDQELRSLIDEKDRLQKEIFDYIQQTTTGEQERQQLQREIESLNKEKSDVVLELNRFMDDLEAKRVAIEKLMEQENILERNNKELENAFKTYREDTEVKVKNLETELQGKIKEIDSKTDAVNILMSEVKMGTDARSKLEAVVHKLKKDMEREKNTAKEKESELVKRIEQLEATIKDREDELTEQLTVILQTRTEKERLQEKIQDMRQTIDNVNRELNGRPQSTHPQPETDGSNGPSHLKKPNTPTQNRSVLAMRRGAHREANTDIYNNFSDSSGDTIDLSLVRSRFAALARGENPPSLPPSAFKRRKNVEQMNVPSSLPQAGGDAKKKERIFFKSTRLEPQKNKK